MSSFTAYNSTVYTSIQATRRGTDNTMAKIKRTKGKIMIYKTHILIKIE